ncbi:hypothetical protein V8C40DRAFT_234739 [Trichoderma camerunense]
MYKYKSGRAEDMGGCGHLPRKGSWIVGTPLDSIVDGIFLIVYSVFSYDVQIFDGQEVRRAGR